MRTLFDAGLDNSTPYVRLTDVVGSIVAITDARPRDGQFGPEIVLSLQLLSARFDVNGNEIPTIFRASMERTDARMAYVRAFEDSREPIGPCEIVQLPPTKVGQSGAIVFNDASRLLEAEALPAPERQAVAAPAGRRNGRGQAAPAGDLEELRF